MRRQGLLRAGLERLAGQRAVRPARRRGLLGGALGAGLRRVRRRGEARLAAGPRHPFLPTVGWAERGDAAGGRARQLGAALPRRLGHRHRAWWSRSSRTRRAGGRAPGWSPSTTGTGSTSSSSRRARSRACAARCSADDRAPRRRLQPRGGRRVRAHRPAVVVTTGGIGANHDLVRRYWPERLGTPPARWSPACRRTSTAACSTSPPRPAPGWSTATGCGTTPRACRTGTRSGPATASGSCPARRRCGSTRSAGGCPRPCLPGYDTLGTLRHLRTTRTSPGYDHSWFILTQRIIEKEFALSGSEQNPDITEQGPARVPARAAAGQGRARRRWRRSSATAPTSSSPTPWSELVAEMNALTDEPLLDAAEIRAPDRGARPRRSPTRTARTPRCRASATRAATSATGSAAPRAPHRILDPAARPADRRQAAHPHPQDPRRHPDRPGLPGARRRRAAGRRAVRGGRGRRVRRRRRARLQRAGRHLPRRLPVLRPRGRPRRRRAARLTVPCAAGPFST